MDHVDRLFEVCPRATMIFPILRVWAAPVIECIGFAGIGADDKLDVEAVLPSMEGFEQ